ncbi:hypothetical protein ACUZ8Y_22880 [Aeromonas veronii]|uniref:hypothetical protein n=1 Tax=Aeromonas veronii TaxID=654 RepID=UPI00406BA1B0
MGLGTMGALPVPVPVPVLVLVSGIAALRWGRCLRLAPGLLMSSAPRVATAGDPVRAVPAGLVFAAGPPAADRLGVMGGHCW